MDPQIAEKWFAYRDNRNNTAHDYGEAFAEQTVKLIEPFLADAASLREIIHARSTSD